MVFQNESVRFFFKDTQSTFEKSRKMTGVTLRCKWITWAMFMGPWSGARPPIREAITKMYTYHRYRAPSSLAKTHSPLCIIFKKSINPIEKMNGFSVGWSHSSTP